MNKSENSYDFDVLLKTPFSMPKKTAYNISTLLVSANVRTLSCFSLRTCAGTNSGRHPALPISIESQVNIQDEKEST